MTANVKYNRSSGFNSIKLSKHNKLINMKTLNYKRITRYFGYILLAPVVRFLGLKGSWKWAVNEMKKGKLLVTTDVTGSIKYRLSNDGQFRLQWDFSRKENDAKWEDAKFFISDMMATNWVIYNWC